MRVLEAHLQAHESRPAARTDWLAVGQPPEQRLLKFDAWIRRELAERLDWAWAGPHREKRLEQCRVYLERIVLDLWRRGWLLDGKALAQRLTGVLEVIGAYQRAGKVRDFWPYFRSAVDRYVGLNSEELQEESRRAGAHVQQALSALLSRRPTAVETTPAMPELIAQRAAEIAAARPETLRQKQARARREQRSCTPPAKQLKLL